MEDIPFVRTRKILRNKPNAKYGDTVWRRGNIVLEHTEEKLAKCVNIYGPRIRRLNKMKILMPCKYPPASIQPEKTYNIVVIRWQYFQINMEA